jgi:uncharacterized membrane protein
MQIFSRFFIRGMETLVPIGITLYALYWLAVFAESWLGEVIRPLVPSTWNWPGIGLVVGLLAAMVLVFVFGLLVSTRPGRWLVVSGEWLLGRIPLVKSFLQTMHDFMRLFVAPHERGDFGQVVWVPFGDMHLIGFVVRGPSYGQAAAGDRTVAVYVPFSYQIGGFTVYLPRSRLEPTGLSVEEAMRLVLTAGVSMAEPPRAVPPPKAPD